MANFPCFVFLYFPLIFFFTFYILWLCLPVSVLGGSIVVTLIIYSRIHWFHSSLWVAEVGHAVGREEGSERVSVGRGGIGKVEGGLLAQLPPVLTASGINHESLLGFRTFLGWCWSREGGAGRWGGGIRPWRLVKSAQGDGDGRQFVGAVFTCLPLLLWSSWSTVARYVCNSEVIEYSESLGILKDYFCAVNSQVSIVLLVFFFVAHFATEKLLPWD